MARPKHKNPTPAELEILQIIWDKGPSTVREVMNSLKPQKNRAYTSVMSLMNVMAEKNLLTQKPKGRAFIYSAKISQQKAQSKMLTDLLDRAFNGSANTLVTHLLNESNKEELDEIRKTIKNFTKKEGDK